MTAGMRKRAPNQLSPAREVELLDAARQVFIERGLGNGTTDEIARRARVSKTTLYRRYRSKEELFAAVINREALVMQADLQDFELSVEQPECSLRNAALTFRKTAGSERHTEIRRLMLAEGKRHPQLVLEARNKLYDATAARLVPFFEELMRLKKMRPMDAGRAVATFGIVFAGGFRPLYNVQEPPEVEDRLFEQDLELFLRGWLMPETSP